MSYKFRKVLYFINKLISIAAQLGIAAALVMALVEPGEWLKWIIRAVIFIAAYLLAKVISIIRKSKFPVPGIDYY